MTIKERLLFLEKKVELQDKDLNNIWEHLKKHLEVLELANKRMKETESTLQKLLELLAGENDE